MAITEMIRQVEQLPADAQELVVDFIEMLQRIYVQPHMLYQRDDNLRKHFGVVRTDNMSGSDNESIDADLALEYGQDQ